MVVPSPAPRRVATPSWLDLRLVLGVVLVLASVLIGATVFSAADHRYAMVTASRDLAAGTILRGDDVLLTQVQLPDHGEGVYLERTTDVIGKQLNRSVSAGELLPAAAVGRVLPKTTVTIPFAAGAAPDLRPGQRIEIWVSTTSCASVVLLPDVTVQDVRTDAGGSFTTGTGGQDVVVSVDPPLAGRVVAALALDQAQIRAGILVGHTRPASPATPDAPGDTGLPADLASCTAGGR